MSEFILKKHNVKKAIFSENNELEKKNGIDVTVGGGISIPKDFTESRNIIVQLDFKFGNEDERLFMALQTVTIFELNGELEEKLDDEFVRNSCLPMALAQLRKTVKNVSEAYGRGPIDLPPFEEENFA